MSEFTVPERRVEIRGLDGFSLKQLVEDDAQAYFDLIAYDRAHLSQDHNGEPDATADKYPTLESVIDSIKSPTNPKKLRFGIWPSDVMVGSNNLTPLDEQGYAVESGSWIGKKYTGHHYASRARELLIDLAFNRLGYQLIVSEIAVGNEASRRSVEKSGFKFMGTVEKPDVWGEYRQYWRYELVLR